MPRVIDTGRGKALGTVLNMQEATYRHLFSKSHWNAITRGGVHAAGAYFVRVDLPHRFGQGALKLRYWGKNKQSPLVVTGRLRAGLLQRAYPEARATASNVSLTIRMPVPTMLDSHGQGVGRNYYANPVVRRVLHTITPAELRQMSKVMHARMAELIAGAAATTTGGRQALALTVTQRQSLASTLKPNKRTP